MHLMIDLETMGTRPNAVILEFGWALFDIKEQGVFNSGIIYPDLEEQVSVGREMDVQTIMWWMRQSEEARKRLTGNHERVSLVDFIRELDMQITWTALDGVWAKSPQFDLIIMRDLYRRCGVLAPWDVRLERDVRTLHCLYPARGLNNGLLKHSAQDDAINQALDVQGAYLDFMANELRGCG